ncbi:MAG: NADH-quinone oxidoreductase subunit J [Candidatus Bathyarchaeia archaeon]
MILELVGAGLVISACLAIFLDEAVYSVAALSGTFILAALLYALSGAPYVAIFQFAVGIGTLSILFLSGEMLSEKPEKKTKPIVAVSVVVLGVVLSLPAIFLSISSPNSSALGAPFGEALWDLRAVDVVLQGLVILTVALGVAIVLYERKRNGAKREGAP